MDEGSFFGSGLGDMRDARDPRDLRDARDPREMRDVRDPCEEPEEASGWWVFRNPGVV